ncbi:chitobiase/beta-hexosaminidase C-terminal domain-containing protein [Pelotomaculum isophthalicicum JI]|uniref:Chitobiase/beta-hexosaminidase C-terminal domain-containing protein n=1 Tax=Pelotomaculum isophthalicicum JI TaxID=947010 RepID=A0A9X4H2L4_9FIRM|nr:chitobiase/beta-hexosaminidase C-terminal domain-containing protein [Pelotomaculum isophthalicicum]MDF9409006.1 chitobiase/beta-hexosaminidase C-terminal domain-containing protein [Pelotomaculum isophthalicicum JI]
MTNPTTFTVVQLQAMDAQYKLIEQPYSTINTWPTKKFYRATGVKLQHLLDLAGITASAKQLKFYTTDGFAITLTRQELLQDTRYYYPNFKNVDPGDSDGYKFNEDSDNNAAAVEPILAYSSASGGANDTSPPQASSMNGDSALLLIFGQRAVSEQTNTFFLKYVNRIEVFTTQPDQWDSSIQASPASGPPPANGQVALSIPGAPDNGQEDTDKIYYTTDGSTPTLNSPIYNWIGSRWWVDRAAVLNTINHPITVGTTGETAIKAVRIGPPGYTPSNSGKTNSDVQTFVYTNRAKGDIDYDGYIDVTDLGIMIDIISAEYTPNDFEFYAADINSDGYVDVTDYGMLIDLISG